MDTPMNPQPLILDPAYIDWREEFESFELRCFGEFCEFVRMNFDELLDDYYGEGQQSLQAFPAWAFERYLQYAEVSGGSDNFE